MHSSHSFQLIGIVSDKFRFRALFFLSLFVTTTALATEERKGAPAPQNDRVGFPTDYAAKFTVLRTNLDLANAKQVTIYGNAQAASVGQPSALPYPNGSVIVMETASLKKNPDGTAATDVNGKFLQDLVLSLHVMRREAGFGQAYGVNRSGEWEYVEYHADGSFITPPQKSASCSECHVKAGREKDYVFKARFAGK
jgi:Cytochrome P460